MLYRPEGNISPDGSPWLDSADMTNWAEIIDFGPKCKYITKDLIGWRVLCPERVPRLVQDDFLVREDLLKYAVSPAGDNDAKQE